MATELYDHISIDEIKQGLDAFVPDIAVLASTMSDLVAFAISQPANVDVNEILFRPTVQPQKSGTDLSGRPGVHRRAPRVPLSGRGLTE
ncbi:MULTISPECIES: Rossmann-fold NAD(P)-binding domain-containing protein [Mameliella]|uniref:hypothetical protein n=1 Tax=Mameliella TaxID=1434019 RepID=UPI00180AAC9E|nr:hypothetical protein [Mameliella alba]MCR9275637.1 hypothetical protein [Paracoccaceae bacterium]